MAKKELDKKEVEAIVMDNIANGVETGIVPLDLVLGGKMPLGTIIELNSESGVGKTSLALYLSSKLCKMGKKVYYIDIERGIDNGIMKNMKLLDHLSMVVKDREDTLDFRDKSFIVDQRTSLYTEFQSTMDWCLGKDPKDRLKKPVRNENTPDLIVLDSLAMLMPDGSKEKTIDSNVSNNMISARYATQTFKDMVGDLASVGTTLLFINHTQTKMKKIGFSGSMAYQDSAGSSMVKYGPSIRLYMDKSSEIKVMRDTIVGKKECRIGTTAEIYTKKSRVADNGVRIPIKLLDAFGVFNGYTLKPIIENLGWVTGASGHYYIQNPIIPAALKEKVTEKGYYVNGVNNLEIFCQQNAGLIVTELKKAGLFTLTLDRANHNSMMDIMSNIEVKKK